VRLYWLIVYLLWRIHFGYIYTTRLLSLYNSLNWLLSLYNSTSWLQRFYLANFIYQNSNLISTWISTRFGLQSWIPSRPNFFLNSVFNLNRIIWSLFWLRLLDLNQPKLLIFIRLNLNQVLYLGIILGSDSFSFPPSTQINPFIWLRFNFISLLNGSCRNLMFPCTKRSLTQSKEVSLSCMFLSCLTFLPESLPGPVTPYPILPRRLLGFLPEIVPDSLLESLPRTLPELLFIPSSPLILLNTIIFLSV
jgi:hypothetical protein